MENLVVLIGRLGKDPSLRYSSNGTSISNFNLAVERSWDDKVDWIPVVCFKKLAEACAQNLNKGRLVYVKGRLQIRKNEKNGRTYINPEVVADNVQFLDWPDNDENKANSDMREQATNNTARDNERVEQEDEDFETPF